jgi:predicted enzyme related to lactoylglutathione lyase
MTDASLQMGLVLDCADPEQLAQFWGPALRYTYLGAVENYALLVPESGTGPKLLLQKVSEPKTSKNRMHLDIETRQVDAEVARLLALGASRIDADDHHEHGNRWVVMADPEGNEFCVCTGGQPED